MEAMQPLDSQREELLSVLKDTLDHSVQLGGSEQHYPMRHESLRVHKCSEGFQASILGLFHQ